MKISLSLLLLLFVWLGTVNAAVEIEEVNPYRDFRENTYKQQAQYLQRVIEHQSKIMTDMEAKLEQQQWQTTAIAIMVMVMVIFGLVLSALQFYSDYKNQGKSSVTLKIGSGSFELSSTVIGIAILAMSFWFFHTYVDRVYSVNVFQVQPVDVTTFGVNR